MILRFLFFLFIGYLLYQFIFRFVIPIYVTTRKVKKNFREMQERMQQTHMNEQGHRQQQPAAGRKEQQGDYIDFEEVKD